jgi:predicted dithiol-disulfide oxidoreductase (DUF899 family)
MEAVAAARRDLPPGGTVPENYVFEGGETDGTTVDVRLSELFAPGKDPIVIYNFMFPRSYRGDRPGPYSGQTALLPRLVTWADERRWRHLRLLSSARNSYNRDYFGETADGSRMPMLNVFHRGGDNVRHVWGAELTYAPTDPGQDHRSVGTLEPLWNLFDLTPEGRPDWDEQISYP